MCNPLSLILGKICPAYKVCKNACILERERESTSQVFVEPSNLVPIVAKSRILIVGSGPAGLSVSGVLIKRGHDIEVWDKEEKFGGALRLIPDERLDKHRIDEIVKELTKKGAVFKNNTWFDFSNISQYLMNFNKIILATGTQRAKKLGIEGEDSANVIMSLDYLKKPVKAGKVVVIGGGDVAVDCAFIASKTSESVKLCYRKNEENMRACKSEIRKAKEKGVCFEFELAPKSITRNGVFFQKNDEEVFINADLVIVAIGQSSKLPSEIQNIPNVFVVGDAATGASSITKAVADAKQFAYSIR